jgi:hypothetical protein
VIPSRAHQISETGHKTYFEYLWRAEGCGKVARYDLGGDRFVLASVDALCDPYANACAGCACTGSFLAWRLQETGVKPYRGDDGVRLRVDIVYGTPYVEVLQQRGQSWRVVCEGSCLGALDPRATYRMQIWTDYPFRSSPPFSPPAGRRSVTVRVKSAYAGEPRPPEISFADDEEHHFHFVDLTWDAGAADAAR